jgi:hypothetical protein
VDPVQYRHSCSIKCLRLVLNRFAIDLEHQMVTAPEPETTVAAAPVLRKISSTSYAAGVAWIAKHEAHEEPSGEVLSEASVADFPSVVLLAHLFGVHPTVLARDVCWELAHLRVAASQG